MPELTETEMSCGIRILSNLCHHPDMFIPNDAIPPNVILLEAFNTHYGAAQELWAGLPEFESDIRFGVVLFSDSLRRGNGKKLAAYITKNGLGKVVASRVIRNPNTRRDIQMWTWYLDREALIAWFKSNK